jgi:N-acyl homoserine lactone hydrolase
MKTTILTTAFGLMLAANSAFAVDRLANKGEQVCWLETSAGKIDAAMGGAGIRDSKVWDSTISSVLIRHPKGDVLIDTGFAPDAEAQMSELPDANRAFGLQILSGAKDRKSIVDSLATVDEKPENVARIVITHAHYDHLGGAVQLTAPIYVTSIESTWMEDQAAHPTITPSSLVAAVRPRIRTLAYSSGPYLGFASSDDIYGDGSIVAVPLPGHTPGAQGVFVKLGKRRVFLIGDATDMLEAAVRGLPKSSPIRAATDSDPELADAQAKRIAEFHHLHPDIAIVPAHDRAAYSSVFGCASNCLSSFKAAS